MPKSTLNNCRASSLKEEFDKELDDDAKLLQFLYFLWIKLPILNEIHPNM